MKTKIFIVSIFVFILFLFGYPLAFAHSIRNDYSQYKDMNNLVDVTTFIVLAVNMVALLFVVYQSYLAKQALDATRKSIDDAKIQRQLEILPKFNWVLEVQVSLERWRDDLKDRRAKLHQAIEENNEDILKGLSNTNIKNPKDLYLNRFVYDHMPSWLREIWMSGAQYYYNSMASMQYLWEETKKPSYTLAGSLEISCEESSNAISSLLGYIQDMVPPVILESPASLSDIDFFGN